MGFAGAVLRLFIIFNSNWDKDEPQSLRYAITPNCSKGADGGHQRTFFKWLINNGWVFRERRTNRPIPYADKRKDGLMEVVASTVWVHGAEVAVQSTYITRKGLNTIAETLGIKLWP